MFKQRSIPIDTRCHLHYLDRLEALKWFCLTHVIFTLMVTLTITPIWDGSQYGKSPMTRLCLGMHQNPHQNHRQGQNQPEPEPKNSEPTKINLNLTLF